jgi:hypothetical protein
MKRVWLAPYLAGTVSILTLAGGLTPAAAEPPAAPGAFPLELWAPPRAAVRRDPESFGMDIGLELIATGRPFEIPLRGDRAGDPIAHLINKYGRLRTIEPAPDAELWLTTSNRDGRDEPEPTDDRLLALDVRTSPSIQQVRRTQMR